MKYFPPFLLPLESGFEVGLLITNLELFTAGVDSWLFTGCNGCFLLCLPSRDVSMLYVTLSTARDLGSLSTTYTFLSLSLSFGNLQM